MGCELPVKASTNCSSVHFNRSSPQSHQLPGLSLARGQSPQNAKPAGTQQIANYTGQLDSHLFQQTLDLILQSHPVAPELRLHPCQASPNTLFPLGDKA